MTLYLKNASFIDWKTLEITRGHLVVGEGAGGAPQFVDIIPDGAEVFDCEGKWVTRAFAVAHHHIYSALARGMPAPAKTPSSFVEILEYVWWNLDKKLDREMIRASARVCAIESAKAGSTFVIDHHASPFAVEDCLHVIAEAFDEVGVSHLLCYELSDRDGGKSRAQGLAETEAYLQKRPGLVGLHASFTVSDGLLEQAVALANAYHSGLHIHVAEARSDQEHCLAHHGMRVVERLARAGGLKSSKTLLAHCIHLDERERERIAESPVWVVQNAESNLNNAVGTFDGRGFLSKVLIGTDGMHSDMLAAARAAFLTNQPHLPMPEAYARLRRVHGYLEQFNPPRTGQEEQPGKSVGQHGQLGEGGKQYARPAAGENDLVILDYDPPTPVHSGNWLGHLFFGLNQSHVHSVIRAGRPIVRDHQLLTVDEKEIMLEARTQAKRLWARM